LYSALKRRRTGRSLTSGSGIGAAWATRARGAKGSSISFVGPLPALAACHLFPAGGCLTRSWQRGPRREGPGDTAGPDPRPPVAHRADGPQAHDEAGPGRVPPLFIEDPSCRHLPARSHEAPVTDPTGDGALNPGPADLLLRLGRLGRLAGPTLGCRTCRRLRRSRGRRRRGLAGKALLSPAGTGWTIGAVVHERLG